jgi:hypothetical protein
VLEASIRRTGTTKGACRLRLTFMGQVAEACRVISIDLICLTSSSFGTILELSFFLLPIISSRSASLSTCFQSSLSYKYGAANSLKLVETRMHRARAVLSVSCRRWERIDLRTSIGSGSVVGCFEGGVGIEGEVIFGCDETYQPDTMYMHGTYLFFHLLLSTCSSSLGSLLPFYHGRKSKR